MTKNDLVGIVQTMAATIAVGFVVLAIAVVFDFINWTRAGIFKSRIQEEPEEDLIASFCTVPSGSEFENFIYTEDGVQYLDYYAYFSQYAVTQAARRSSSFSKLKIIKGDTIAFLVQTPFGESSPTSAGIEIDTDDRYFIADKPEELDGLLIVDKRLGVSLTENRFNALVNFAKSDQPCDAEHCPFAGYDIPHHEEVATVKTDPDGSSSIVFEPIQHYD